MEKTVVKHTPKLNQTGLVKDLIKDPNQKVQQEEKLLTQVNLLLEEKTQDDRDLLKRTGLDTLVAQAEEQKGKTMMRIQYRKKYLDLPIVDSKEIERLCSVYNLVMVKAEKYVGAPPPVELMDTLRELDKVAHFSKDEMFIICPIDATEYKPATFEQARNLSSKRRAEAAERLRAMLEEDPILLFKIPKTDEYVVCQAWGNDLSPLRKAATVMANLFAALFVPLFLFMNFVVATYVANLAKTHEWIMIDKNSTSNVQTPIVGQILAWVLCFVAGIVLIRLLSGLLFGDFNFLNVFKIVKDWKKTKHSLMANYYPNSCPLLFYW